MLQIAQGFFFLVFIVDYNHCALNSKQAIEARTLKIRKERLSQCRPSRSSQPLLSCKANSAVQKKLHSLASVLKLSIAAVAIGLSRSRQYTTAVYSSRVTAALLKELIEESNSLTDPRHLRTESQKNSEPICLRSVIVSEFSEISNKFCEKLPRIQTVIV